MLDDPGRVRNHIINVVCQIQWFDFDCNLVVTRKVIIRIPPGLDLNHLLNLVYQSLVHTGGLTLVISITIYLVCIVVVQN
jgi:hypothetical protein